MKKEGLDHTDKAIIKELQKNGRESYKNIARKLNISDGTVRLRTEKLIKNGYLKISALINPLYFENSIIAHVGINLKNRAHREIMEEISKIDPVISVQNVTGRYDILVEIYVNSRKDLRKFLVEELSAIKGITSTESFICLEAIDKWI
ncbi:MAG: Lrp/AsnC family transcriptional regulator [Desulfobacterales bacterium]|nr:Lrp/AsnC family transcriptional regulator [Desulfobacterales bacterium]MCP4160061.1 Lrp/AsnC family transcriptional regulator [Deltaproteobacteria bacterium]